MSSEGGSFAHLSFHVATDWHVRCHAYEDHTPILDIDAGPTAVSLNIKGRNADEAAVEFARALAREAQKFAAEVERFHAVQPGATSDGIDDGEDKAANSNAA